MRHYHPFPEAIPLSEAGYSRVTHPSATKNFNKSKSSVRLACVRRAASVHPEPGSNSLKKLYISRVLKLLIILFHYESLAITDFSVFSDFSCIPDQKSRNFKGRNFFCIVQFSKCRVPYLSETAYLLYHRFPNLSRGFQNFFCDFLEIVLPSIYCFIQLNSRWFPLLRTTCSLYHKKFILSSLFLNFFRFFSAIHRLHQTTCLLYHILPYLSSLF